MWVHLRFHNLLSNNKDHVRGNAQDRVDSSHHAWNHVQSPPEDIQKQAYEQALPSEWQGIHAEACL